MEQVIESDAGISIDLPLGTVAFAEHAPPFTRYSGTGALQGAAGSNFGTAITPIEC